MGVKNNAGARDAVQVGAGYGRPRRDNAGVRVTGRYELRGPDGALKQEGVIENLVTDHGDEWSARRTANLTAPSVITGMRLGTGTTAVAKTGAGAAIVTYVTGSAEAVTSQILDPGAGWDAEYANTWAAGVATANGIAEMVVTDESPLTNVAGTAGNTVARALLSPVVNKGAGDTLTVTWTHHFEGA